jgi:hypothetical protein
MRQYIKRRNISITKYNPADRNSLGYFNVGDWTSYSDIGKLYNNILLSKEEYEKIELLYIQAVILTLTFFESKSIKITHIFKLSKKQDFIKNDDLNLYKLFKDLDVGKKIENIQLISNLVKLRLREYIVELELIIDEKSRSEILFGFDYNMYLKTNKDVSFLIDKINGIGLFVNDSSNSK